MLNLKLNIHNEKEILNKLAAGDQRAFTVIFDSYYQLLGAYIYKITESKEAAEEIVQEVFIKIWEKREILGEIDSFKAYLFILSKNKTVDYLRAIAKKRVQQLAVLQQMKEESYTMDSVSPLEEYNLIIEKAVSKLPPQQQKVYHLSRYEKLKYEEIALHMGISKETVKKHMKLALAFLKQQVKMQIQNMNLGLLFVALIYF
ncbi:RNA polymerase sigma-70 factor [Sphingobacterium phlebotomi]|uniref:RNA polymerase sigma-70 factor n=1 Tax=Sphingobacterium phlebotomi TaxID=2605433 RepID=A0A5D4H795_9SPHI|nr:RNA polymerase sigma-70 factor [Sphingobacterium phlebotomi]TYR36477.1 RNA polymerase sigma-70 factor [Sphingobacterium phlebotomi]